MRQILYAALAVLALSAPVQAQRAVVTATTTMTRQAADTTTYAIGDLVGNTTTAAAVTPLSFSLSTNAGVPAYIRRLILKKSGTGVTAPNFRLHLFTTLPTINVADNVAFASTSVGWFCDIDVNMFTTDPFNDGNGGIGVPNNGSECALVNTGSVFYGLLEARGAYVPAAAEVFTFTLEAYLP